MYTSVQIINFGLGKISAQQIERIDPPRTSLERFVTTGYELWKRTELAKRRWVFAVVKNYPMTRTETLVDVEQPYKFALPTDCMRPIRTRYAEWTQSGRFLFSAQDTLSIDYISNVDEADFDVMFVEVLACRVAFECVEYVTQSNAKKADMLNAYNAAVAEAGRCNAYTIGAESNTLDDNQYPFLTERY